MLQEIEASYKKYYRFDRGAKKHFWVTQTTNETEKIVENDSITLVLWKVQVKPATSQVCITGEQEEPPPPRCITPASEARASKKPTPGVPPIKGCIFQEGRAILNEI